MLENYKTYHIDHIDHINHDISWIEMLMIHQTKIDKEKMLKMIKSLRYKKWLIQFGLYETIELVGL